MRELARGMRDFDLEDEAALRDLYAMLVNVTQPHAFGSATLTREPWPPRPSDYR